MRFAVVITSLPNNYSAYVPDLPGCVATGATTDEVERNIREAIEAHVAAMVEDGDPLPAYPSYGATVEISVAAEKAYA